MCYYVIAKKWGKREKYSKDSVAGSYTFDISKAELFSEILINMDEFLMEEGEYLVEVEIVNKILKRVEK